MIVLKNIVVEHHQQVILKDFNLRIHAKERLVIWGRSGAGKSTVLRLIAGLDVPDLGEVWLNGALVTKDQKLLLAPHEREVNMVFQDLALWSHLDVQNNIDFGLRIAKQSKKIRLKKVQKMLLLLGLEGYENRRIETLSGGEQQRVALARALVMKPKILLMDEPLSGLDKQRTTEILEEILNLQQRLGFTLVYVTHNQEEVERIATRILEL
jgi:ABC-type sugar transport system ATPase subunit